MSRTCGHNWGGKDYWPREAQLERTSRPAGRIANLVNAEATAERDPITTPGINADKARYRRPYTPSITPTESEDWFYSQRSFDAWYDTMSAEGDENTYATPVEPEADEAIDPACGGWGTSLDYEGWYGFHVFVAH